MITCAYCRVRNKSDAPFCLSCGAPFVEETLRKITHVGNDQVFVDYISREPVVDIKRDFAQRREELQRDYYRRMQDLEQDFRQQMYEASR